MKLILNDYEVGDELFVAYINYGHPEFYKCTIEKITPFARHMNEITPATFTLKSEKYEETVEICYVGCGYFNGVISNTKGLGGVFDTRENMKDMTLEYYRRIYKELTTDLVELRERIEVVEASKFIFNGMLYDAEREFEND